MDAGEFDRWYAGSYPRLVAQLTALIGNRAEAQDCVQEAFIRAWDKAPRLDSTGERDAWVRTTAYRLAVSRWRRVRRGRELSARTAVTGYDALARSEVRADVLGALLRLPIDQRCVLVLPIAASPRSPPRREHPRGRSRPACTVGDWLSPTF